ncbi:MAG: 5-oxoprolinase subunit PxpB [Bacillota bacterium]|nr:5-oxoprolinase subunit PxpB [Bacillota bacterium]
MKYEKPRILISGEDAVVVEFGDGIDSAINADVHKLMAALESMQLDYIVEMVPTYRSLLIQYNPLLISHSEITGILLEKINGKKEKKSIKNAWFIPKSNVNYKEDRGGVSSGGYEDYVRLIEIPTLYGGEHGADLAHVAETNGLSEVDVVRIHSGRDYLVYMLGFMPGFPYLGGLDERIHTPRLSNPRAKISAGSVGIAGSQTGIYPVDSPGGWRLIGRTPLRLYDAEAETPVFVSAGDYIRYVPIGLSEFNRIAKTKGYQPTVRLVHRSEVLDSVHVEIRQDDLGDFGREYVPENTGQTLKLLSDGHVVPGMRDEKNVRVKVLNPGALTTVQDLGRAGYQKVGIPVSGAMDQLSSRLANILVGNGEEEAVLEATYIGPELLFEDSTEIAITGARLQPKINGARIPMYRAISVEKGDVLSFGPSEAGVRTYIAVAGSLCVPVVNGSKSTYLKSQIGGLDGRRLQKEDVLEFVCTGDDSGVKKDVDVLEILGDLAEMPEKKCMVNVVLGPQDDCFTEEGLRTLFSGDGYEITAESDRMGMKLSGAKITHARGADIVSDATVFGAVQVPASGQPIVLLADRQTTGGYTKIGTVIKEDVYRLAQAAPGTHVSFRVIGIDAAQQRYRAFFQKLEEVKRALKRRNQ